MRQDTDFYYPLITPVKLVRSIGVLREVVGYLSSNLDEASRYHKKLSSVGKLRDLPSIFQLSDDKVVSAQIGQQLLDEALFI